MLAMVGDLNSLSVWITLTIFYILALRNGGRFRWLWLATVLHGLTVECVSYFLPDIDNFWHAQGVITFLGLRLPLYIALLCKYILCRVKKLCNHFGFVVVSNLASSVIDHVFDPWSGQTKDYKIGICFFSTKHAASRSKNKDWLAQSQNNVSE